jgi:hypothetical protein
MAPVGSVVRPFSLDLFPKHRSSTTPGSLLGVPGPAMVSWPLELLYPSWSSTHSASRSRQTPGGDGGSGCLERRQGPGARHPAGEGGHPPAPGRPLSSCAPRLAEGVSLTVDCHPPAAPIHFMAAQGAPSPQQPAELLRPHPFPAALPGLLPFQL